MLNKESPWSKLLTPPNAGVYFRNVPLLEALPYYTCNQSISQESSCFMTKYSCDYKALQGLHRRCFVNWIGTFAHSHAKPFAIQVRQKKKKKKNHLCCYFTLRKASSSELPLIFRPTSLGYRPRIRRGYKEHTFPLYLFFFKIKSGYLAEGVKMEKERV
jgi:hypothetical protein